MTLHSALEDLRRTTLKAISGGLRRLEYLSGLRDAAGAYGHWGMERVYGELSAKKALIQAHRTLLSQILSTPIRRLLEDVEQSVAGDGLSPSAYLEQLGRHGPDLLPLDPGAGAARHLNSVLHALSKLARTRSWDAIRPIS